MPEALTAQSSHAEDGGSDPENAWDISLDAEVVPVSDSRSQMELDPNRVNAAKKEAPARAFVPGDIRLDCVSGSLQGRQFVLDKLRMVIGRDAKADIVVDEVAVSREHASLSYEQPWLVVRDLKSRNGVYLNDRKVEEAVLRPGEQVRVGRCVFEAHEVIPEAEVV